jgi:hypothetical protein
MRYFEMSTERLAYVTRLAVMLYLAFSGVDPSVILVHCIGRVLDEGTCSPYFVPHVPTLAITIHRIDFSYAY